jgi:dihydroxy-acid dehydratase
VTELRSARWFAGDELSGFIHRASIHAEGISRAALAGRPVVGICNPWSELVNCNLHFKGLAESVRRGVLLAGGLPLEFGALALGENLMKPTAMLYRNLMAMDVEESIRAYPLDAVVLIGGCDKTVPAELMGAASADVPAIMITGGPAQPAWFRGRQLGAGTDLWHYVDELRSGRMSREEFAELEAAATPGYGHCNEMGTASTMTSLVEALGMSLPGTASIPAVDAARGRAAEETGTRAVELAREGLRPSQVMTAEAFDNAITLLMAIGGGTNAVVHLLAIAGRLGIDLTLDDFDAIGAGVPLLVNLQPAGRFLMDDFHRAGGLLSVLREVRDLLDPTALTVTGRPLVDHLDDARIWDPEVITARETPLIPDAGIAVLRGNLAPGGAIIKPAAASPHLLQHRGRAVVFDSIEDLHARIDDPDLEVDADSVLVLRGCGPKGYPGMPEVANLPLPKKLLEQGVRDMVRVCDGRMSGTAYGTVVLHVTPEAAAGGALALVEDGDWIVLDVPGRRLTLDLEQEELNRRAPNQATLDGFAKPERGWERLYVDHVLGADTGADLDFLRGSSGDRVSRDSH